MSGILLIAENAEIVKSFTAMLAPAYTVITAASEQAGMNAHLSKPVDIEELILIPEKNRASCRFFSALAALKPLDLPPASLWNFALPARKIP